MWGRGLATAPLPGPAGPARSAPRMCSGNGSCARALPCAHWPPPAARAGPLPPRFPNGGQGGWKRQRALAANTSAVSAAAWGWNKQVTQQRMGLTAPHTCVHTRACAPPGPAFPHRGPCAPAGRAARRAGRAAQSASPPGQACLLPRVSASLGTRQQSCLSASPSRPSLGLLGAWGPSLSLDRRAGGKAAHPPATCLVTTIHHPSTDPFPPAEQCPAPRGLPVHPLAHHASGFRGNAQFTQPGPPLLLHAHCLQHR